MKLFITVYVHNAEKGVTFYWLSMSLKILFGFILSLDYTLYLRIGHPAARLHLVGIKTPKLQLLFKEWAAHICRIMQLARSVVIQHLFITKSDDELISIYYILHRHVQREQE